MLGADDVGERPPRPDDDDAPMDGAPSDDDPSDGDGDENDDTGLVAGFTAGSELSRCALSEPAPILFNAFSNASSKRCSRWRASAMMPEISSA